MIYGAELEEHIEEALLFNQQAASMNFMPPMDSAEDIIRMRTFLNAPDSPFGALMATPVLPVAR